MAKVPGTKFEMSSTDTTEMVPTADYNQRPSRMKFGKMKLFCGSASHDLGGEIASYIRSRPGYENFHPGLYDRNTFSNENIFIRLKESVRGRDVYLVQTMASPLHDNLMEMLIMIDALKRDSAWRINLVVPYLSYTRSDKKDQPRVPITARLLANMIETAGADRYITVDLHSGQIQGFFNIPGDALTAFHLLSDYVKDHYDLSRLVVVATDLGFAKQGRNWAEALDVPLAFIEKRRVDNAERPKALSLIGDVTGKDVLLVDDEVNTAGSIVNAVNVVREAGAGAVSFAFTHAFLSDIAYERLAALDLKEIIFTNTLPTPAEKRLPNMTVLSVAPLLSEVIIRAHEGRSVGELFDE
ncbi:MAG: ribose-phosphate pyrophosphokinase [Anaerolineae bacterium]|nr:ribose-phosphate pyrophosphokinase [Anaerolineae bacterium]